MYKDLWDTRHNIYPPPKVMVNILIQNKGPSYQKVVSSNTKTAQELNLWACLLTLNCSNYTLGKRVNVLKKIINKSLELIAIQIPRLRKKNKNHRYISPELLYLPIMDHVNPFSSIIIIQLPELQHYLHITPIIIHNQVQFLAIP